MPGREETLAELRGRIAAVQQGEGSASRMSSDDESAGMRKRSGGRSKAAKNKEAEGVEKPKDFGPEACFSRAVALISAAPRTCRDLSFRLKREGFPSPSVDAAIERAKNCALLDDESYAEQYAMIRLSRGYGLRRIADELSGKGIDVTRYEFWADLREEHDGDAEYEAALSFARGRTFSSKNPDKALFAALVRRGYSTSCAYRVVRSINQAD